MDRRGFIKAGAAAALSLASVKLLDASGLLHGIVNNADMDGTENNTENKTDSKMKILILKTSGNKRGSSNMLADEFIRGAKEKGHEITEFDVSRAKIHHCMGCNHCGMAGPCIFDDDMTTLREMLLATDLIVFVTPIYYFGMSAQMKLVIDRFYAFTGELSSAHKKAALLTVAWDSSLESFQYLEEHYKKICRYMHFDNQGIILGRGCGTPSMTRNSEYPQKAYEFGKSI